MVIIYYYRILCREKRERRATVLCLLCPIGKKEWRKDLPSELAKAKKCEAIRAIV